MSCLGKALRGQFTRLLLLVHIMFRGRDQAEEGRAASGGERNRCIPGQDAQIRANVLLLDEPTKDLDVEHPARTASKRRGDLLPAAP